MYTIKEKESRKAKSKSAHGLTRSNLRAKFIFIEITDQTSNVHGHIRNHGMRHEHWHIRNSEPIEISSSSSQNHSNVSFSLVDATRLRSVSAGLRGWLHRRFSHFALLRGASFLKCKEKFIKHPPCSWGANR